MSNLARPASMKLEFIDMHAHPPSMLGNDMLSASISLQLLSFFMEVHGLII